MKYTRRFVRNVPPLEILAPLFQTKLIRIKTWQMTPDNTSQPERYTATQEGNDKMDPLFQF